MLLKDVKAQLADARNSMRHAASLLKALPLGSLEEEEGDDDDDEEEEDKQHR